MAEKYDLVCTRKDQQGKTRYQNVGVMLPAKNGEGYTLIFNALPMPSGDGQAFVSAFVPREKQQQGGYSDHQARLGNEGSAPGPDEGDGPPF